MKNKKMASIDPLLVQLVCGILRQMDELHDEIGVLRNTDSTAANTEIIWKNFTLQSLYKQLEFIGLVEWKTPTSGFKLKLHGSVPGEYYATLNASVVEVVY